MVVIAFLTAPDTVKRILDHLHLPSTMPRIAPARLPDDFLSDLDDGCPDDRPNDLDLDRRHGPAVRTRCSRAPPPLRRTGS